MRSINPLVYFGVAAAMIGGLVGLSEGIPLIGLVNAESHECQVVGKIAGHNAYGYHNGKYQMYWVSAKTVYKCNDGIEYTR